MKVKTAAYAVGGTGLVLFALAVSLGWILVPIVVEYQIAEKIAIKNNTESFDRWERLPVPLDFRVYLFEVVNPKEVTLNGAKPEVRERGPYVYKKSMTKKNIRMFEEEDRAVYDQHFLFYEFSRQESESDDQDQITMLNVPALLFAQISESILGLKISLEYLNEVIHKMWPGDPTFVKTTVRSYLFDGVKMNCNPDADPTLNGNVILKFKWKILCLAYSKLHPQMVTIDDGERGSNSFSFFKYKNVSADGPYEVNLGIKEPKNVGQILKWRGEKTLGSTWGGKSCNTIMGTDTTIYRPYLHDVDVLHIFHSDIHRSINLTYHDDIIYKEVPGRRYVTDDTVFASVQKNLNNYCYCPRSVRNLTSYGGCLKSGLLELSSCQGAPAYLSHPHLLMTDQYYRGMIGGLNPDAERHQTFVDLEPNTGFPLRGAIRMQINVLLKKIPEIDAMKHYPNKIVPVLWFEEAVELSDELVDQIKGQLLHVLDVVDAVRWTALAVGLLFTSVSAIYLCIAAVPR